MLSVEDWRRLEAMLTSVQDDHVVEESGYALDAVCNVVDGADEHPGTASLPRGAMIHSGSARAYRNPPSEESRSCG